MLVPRRYRCIPNGAFVHWAMQLLSVTVQRGNAEMYRRSGLIISRQQGLRYDAGIAVPVFMMGHVYGARLVALPAAFVLLPWYQPCPLSLLSSNLQLVQRRYVYHAARYYNTVKQPAHTHTNHMQPASHHCSHTRSVSLHEQHSHREGPTPMTHHDINTGTAKPVT